MAIIGIDLGTSNSAASVLRGGKPVMIPSSEGLSLSGKAFPSYVAVAVDGQVLVGESARRQAAANPEGTAKAFKRKMGRREKICLRDKEFSPEQLSGFLLQKIKRDAEAFLGETVEKAVVTVPAYFDDNQRSATKDACKIAGLEVLRLVNEPTAASLAYGLDRSREDLKIAVVDFGGGTLDVTILEFGKGVFEVKATSGDTQLGGTDMDEELLLYLLEKFRQQKGVDLSQDMMAVARIKEAAEIAKIELSVTTNTHISLPYVSAKDGQPLHFDMDVNRAELERLVSPVLERCIEPINQALHDAQLSTQEIDRLVFIGGPTRMPIVRRKFEEYFGKTAEAGVDPMESVANGAAIQAGVLSGEVGDIVLVDVTPLTLGVETLGGVATALIARNTPIPIKRTEVFTTAADMQTSVTIHVYQGERPMAANNTSLGEFNLLGLPPAPRGIPKIEVTFDIDSNGILNVSAKDQATGNSQSISISGSTRLSDNEKQKMVDDAEKFAAQDKQLRKKAEQRNEAESLCYQAEKTLADFGEKIAEESKGRIESGIKALKEAVNMEDEAEISRQVESLNKILTEVGTQIYSQSAKSENIPHPQPDVGEPGQQARPSGSGSRGKVVDADYHEA